MKKLVLLAVCFAFSLGLAFSQIGPWDLQVNYGLSATLHYGIPLQRRFCRNGCPTIEQTPGLAQAFSAGISRRVSPRHSIYFAVGYSQLRFQEKSPFISPGLSSFIPPPTDPIDARFGFVNFQLGHSFRLLNWEQHQLVMSNSLLIEHTIQESYHPDYIKPDNYSYLGKIGAVLNFGSPVSLTANATFRTALSTYNRQYDLSQFEDYRPFGMGLEVGMQVKL